MGSIDKSVDSNIKAVSKTKEPANELTAKGLHEKRYMPVILDSDTEFLALVQKRWSQRPKSTEGLLHTLWQQCESIVLRLAENDEVALGMVVRGIDSATLEIVVLEAVEYRPVNDRESLKSELARAMLEEIPVYGEDVRATLLVQTLQAEIIEKGFVTKMNGKDTHLRLTKYNRLINATGKEVLEHLSLSRCINLGELKFLNDRLLRDAAPLEVVAENIVDLEESIEIFRGLLAAQKRNENSLQAFLTSRPIFFGTEYCRVIPKHRLGTEYEMDYALERFDGRVDLAELEASNLRLYNRKGDPSHHLVHAEQQVADWLRWIEENSSYARTSLPKVHSPKAFVIIGRNDSLIEDHRQRLHQRNVLLGGKIEVLTYDDLLHKAETLLSYLRTKKAPSN